MERRSASITLAPLLAALSLCHCERNDGPREPVASPRQVAPARSGDGPTDASPPLGSCEPRPADASPRGRALAALAAGKVTDAARLLAQAVQEQPGDVGAQVLLIAANKEQERRSLALEDALNKAKATTLDINAVPPAPPASGSASSVRLKIASESKNLVIDDGDWLKDNGLRRVVSRPAPAEVPEHLPLRHLGAPLSQLFDHGDHQVAVYNASLVVASPTGAPRAFTFGPQLAWARSAQVVGDTLLVAAESHQSQRLSTRLYAFDLATGKLRWVSAEDVMNGQTFAATTEHVVTGFGGSGLPDHVFLIDLATGKTLQKLAVKSGPEHVQLKDGRLYVRTYDTNVVLEASATLAAPPPAALAPRKADTTPGWQSKTLCAVERALAATDAGDPVQLQLAVEALKAEQIEAPFVGAFEGAQRFFEQHRERGGLFLGAVKPTRLPAPPWEATVLEAAGPAPSSTTPKLVKVSSSKGIGPLVMRRGKYDPARPWFIPPVEKGRLPSGARTDIPTQYGLHDLRAIIPSGDRLLLVYGGRYLAITRGDETEAVFDLEAYLHPPKVSAQWKEFAVAEVTYAQVADGVVYVANGGGSYAKEMYGKKGFVSAISLATKKLLWRSKPLVHGAGPFALTKDFLVTGYGFTDEADNLYLLRRDTGAVATSLPLESAPDEVSIAGDRITVHAYANSYEIDLKR